MKWTFPSASPTHSIPPTILHLTPRVSHRAGGGVREVRDLCGAVDEGQHARAGPGEGSPHGHPHWPKRCGGVHQGDQREGAGDEVQVG